VASAPRRRRRRRFFSLNGLVIQVSAFALSFMLVALLVVGSSRAAFVEENDTVTERVPVGVQEPPPEPAPSVPNSPPRPAPTTRTPAPPAAPPPPAVPVPLPAPAPVPAPGSEPPPAPVPQITLTDDAPDTAMFTDDRGLAPGQPEQRCIRVTLEGDGAVSEPVVLYAAEVRGALAQYLDLTVEVGPDGGTFGDCSGFVPGSTLFSGSLADFGAGHAAFDSGLTAWEPLAPGESRSFRFTATVRDVPEAEGLSARFGFTWEARA
jgi:hypothetical protein